MLKGRLAVQLPWLSTVQPQQNHLILFVPHSLSIEDTSLGPTVWTWGEINDAAVGEFTEQCLAQGMDWGFQVALTTYSSGGCGELYGHSLLRWAFLCCRCRDLEIASLVV